MAVNYAAMLHGPHDVRIEKIPMPKINEKEVLIKIECVGICGSDVKMYTLGKCAMDVVTEPLVMGHEGAGVIVEVGSQVTTFKVGDRVAIEPTQPCRSCQWCKQGRYNLCPKPLYCGSLGSDGNISSYYKHVADFCHKIPDNLSLEEGAAVQPLAIALHACNRAGIRVGCKMAVLGAGPIGVLCAMSARAMGAGDIVITDVVDARLSAAKDLGITKTLNTKGLTEKQTIEKLVDILGDQPDLAIDACAFPSATRVAMQITKTGGTVLVVGISDGLVEVPLSATLLREVDVKGSMRIVNTYPAALLAVANGSINLKKFITHHFPLTKMKQALDCAKSGEAMKVIIHVQQM